MRAPAGDDPGLTLQSNSSPWSLWSIAREGGAPEVLFQHPEIRATRPDTSWVHGKIAFTGIRSGTAELWLINGDGTGLTHVPVGDPPRERVYYPSWYPDGDRIAVTDYLTRQVLSVSVSTGQVSQLTDPDRVWAGMSAVGQIPTERDLLAFAGQRPGGAYSTDENMIWMVRGKERAEPLDGLHGRTPAWSPVDDRLAFSSTRGRRAPVGLMHPRVLPRGRSGIFIGSETLDSPPRIAPVSPLDSVSVHPKWSPSGEEVACMSRDLSTDRRGIAILTL